MKQAVDKIKIKEKIKRVNAEMMGLKLHWRGERMLGKMCWEQGNTL